MYREGIDQRNVEMSDVLCDFCHREWTDDLPMVEGHRGSCICGPCLRTAYAGVVNTRTTMAPESFTCTLCKESDDDRVAEKRASNDGWQSPAYEEAVICKRCIKQASGVLHKDPDWDWRKPPTEPGL